MKIKEEIKKTGVFWLPPYREKVSGSLSISNEERIVLEVAQSVSPDNMATIGHLFGQNSPPLERIIGHIQEHGFIILDGCQSKTDSLKLNFGVMQTSRVIWATRVFTGFPQPPNEIPLFNTLTFSIEGINEWVGIHGIKSEYLPEERSTIISYRTPESLPLNLTDGMKLEITFGVQNTGAHSSGEIEITQKTYFRVVSEEAQELETFLSVAYKIVDLLCLTINETVSLDSLSATSDGLIRDIGNGIIRPARIDIYQPSGFYSINNPQIDRNKMLFRFEDIRDDAEEIIKKWIKGHDEYDHAFNLYFTAQFKPQMSMEAKFLSLAQGLEVYHRKKSGADNERAGVEFEEIIPSLLDICPDEGTRNWLRSRLAYPDQVNLVKRIKEIIEPFKEIIGSSRERGKLARKISVTRNYLTHYNSDLESDAAKGQDLYVLCMEMEMLFELHFLDLMGFSPEKIQSIADNCPKLQWKRSLSLSGDQ